MKSKCLFVFLIVFGLVSEWGFCDSLFTAETWNNNSFRRILSLLSKVSVIETPAEIELSALIKENRKGSYRIRPSIGDIELVSGEDSLLQPIDEYLNKRWPKGLLNLLREKEIDFSIVRGSFLESLYVMRQERVKPVYESLPDIEGGRHLVIGLNQKNSKPELWILGVESDDLLVQQIAMLYAAGIKTDKSRVFLCENDSLPEFYRKSFENWSFEEPELWVIGFRDTMDFTMAQRVRFGETYKALCTEFGFPLSVEMPKKLQCELKTFENLFPKYVKNARTFCSKIVDFDLKSPWIANIDDFKTIGNFLKECKKTFPRGTPGPVARKIREILDDKSSIYFAFSNAGFVNHPNLSFKRMVYEDSKGRTKSFVLISNPYGDQMRHLLNAINSRFPNGKILYLGTAGGLKEGFKVGDYVLLEDLKGKELHSVPSPVLETKESLELLRDSGADLIEVEGRYLAEFANKGKEISLSAIFAVSDLPLKQHSLAGYEENVSALDDVFQKMVDEISKRCDIADIKCGLPDQEEFITRLLKSREEYLLNDLLRIAPKADINAAKHFVRREIERRLVPAWLTRLPSKNEVPDPRIWKKLINKSSSGDYLEVGCFSKEEKITPILGEKFSIWKNSNSGVSVEFFIKELADKAFIQWLKSSSASFVTKAGDRKTPGGKDIYVQGEKLVANIKGVTFTYSPWNFHSYSPEKLSFVADRGMVRVDCGKAEVPKLAEALISFSKSLDAYPFKDDSNLIYGQIPAEWYPKERVNIPSMLVSHKLTGNRRIKEAEAKLLKDMKSIVDLLKYSRLSSYRRRISEGRVSEYSQLRMNEVEDSDIGSGQHHLVYISLGSGISYYDSPWNTAEVAMFAPRLLLRNVFADMALAEFYPRNSWDTAVKGYDRYYMIRCFQGYREFGYAMPLKKRESYFRHLANRLNENGLFDFKDCDDSSFAFMNISGNGALVNNEIRIADSLRLGELVEAILIPFGSKKLYQKDFEKEGLNPDLLVEAWENSDEGMRLAYMSCQLRRFYKNSANLEREAKSKPFLKKCLRKAVAEMSLNSYPKFKP